MTKLLEEAFALAARLSPADQDALAAAILAEVEAEPKWRTAFTESGVALSQLAREAIEEYRSGQSEPLDPDRL